MSLHQPSLNLPLNWKSQPRRHLERLTLHWTLLSDRAVFLQGMHPGQQLASTHSLALTAGHCISLDRHQRTRKCETGSPLTSTVVQKRIKAGHEGYGPQHYSDTTTMYLLCDDNSGLQKATLSGLTICTINQHHRSGATCPSQHENQIDNHLGCCAHQL